MYNMFKMDCRRLARSRSFYVILAVTAGFLIFMNLMLSVISSPETMDAFEAEGMEVTEEDRSLGEEINSMTQVEFVHQSLSNGFLLMLVGMGVTFFVSSDFAHGAVKNICLAHPRRWEYPVSKALTAGAYSAVVTVLSVFLSLLLPPVCGLHPTPSSAADILLYTFWMWLPVQNYMLSSVVSLYCAPPIGPHEIMVVLACTAGWGALYMIISLLLMIKRDI